ncbi:510_t:CDS:2, partial [Acaulospora colombiana]
ESFTRDLILSPRGAEDVSHQISAVASSTSSDKAKEFIAKTKLPSDVRSYGSYEELIQDKDINIIYVATPQSRHYQDVKSALDAGKHVLCESSPSHLMPHFILVTINVLQAIRLAELAREKQLFLMEAAWTRFFPITKQVLKIIHEERRIGNVRRLIADFSLRIEDERSRLHDPYLGGGALLDLGFYPITWGNLILHNHPDNQRSTPRVTATMVKTKRGVDEFTSITLYYEKLGAVAHLTTSLAARTTAPHGVLIQGDKGYLALSGVPCRPEECTIKLDGQEAENINVEYTGHGLAYQADECARAIRDAAKLSVYSRRHREVTYCYKHRTDDNDDTSNDTETHRQEELGDESKNSNTNNKNSKHEILWPDYRNSKDNHSEGGDNAAPNAEERNRVEDYLQAPVPPRTPINATLAQQVNRYSLYMTDTHPTAISLWVGVPFSAGGSSVSDGALF